MSCTKQDGCNFISLTIFQEKVEAQSRFTTTPPHHNHCKGGQCLAYFFPLSEPCVDSLISETPFSINMLMCRVVLPEPPTNKKALMLSQGRMSFVRGSEAKGLAPKFCMFQIMVVAIAPKLNMLTPKPPQKCNRTNIINRWWQCPLPLNIY